MTEADALNLIRKWSGAWCWDNAYESVTSMGKERDAASYWHARASAADNLDAADVTRGYARHHEQAAETWRGVVLTLTGELLTIQNWMRQNCPRLVGEMPNVNLLDGPPDAADSQALADRMLRLEGSVLAEVDRRQDAAGSETGDDESAYILASKIFVERFGKGSTGYSRGKRYLENIPESEIRRIQKPRRFLIHAADWVRHWETKDEKVDALTEEDFDAHCVSREVRENREAEKQKQKPSGSRK